MRNSGGKQCPRGFDAGPVQVHLSDTDEVTGGTGEDGGKVAGRQAAHHQGEQRGERAGRVGIWANVSRKFRVLVPTSMSSGMGKEEQKTGS